MMVDPVIIETGMTYEREAIEGWFAKGKDTCPMTGTKLKSTQVIPNFALRQRIERWNEARVRVHHWLSSSMPARVVYSCRLCCCASIPR